MRYIALQVQQLSLDKEQQRLAAIAEKADLEEKLHTSKAELERLQAQAQQHHLDAERAREQLHEKQESLVTYR